MKNKIIFTILILGILYKLSLTFGGNFLFNMDNARDMVDVREMVVLKKLRLIGPTSAIEGLFNGPGWYYLLAIPFILSGGDPYGSIILQITLWVIGGFFLLKLVSRISAALIIPIGFVWIASDYINLATSYAFNPNPVTLLTPLFIYLLVKFLESGKFFYIVSTFFLAGLFFNFEMNFGVFTPWIIFFSTYLINKKLLKSANFWLASLFFIICLLPQVLFDLRHNFFMTNSVINFLRNSNGGQFNIFTRIQTLSLSFYEVFQATLLNHRTFATILILLFLPVIGKIKGKNLEKIALICLVYIFTPFIFFLFLPVTVNAWHLGGPAVAFIILIAFLIKQLWQINFAGRLISFLIFVMLIWYSVFGISKFYFHDKYIVNNDPSLYKNELAAVDYVYQYAKGENFKVYVFLPSVIDYPYQYLFWWYGKKKYSYIPFEYAYAPNKPQYIPSKEKFEGLKENYKGLVFLIKEPNRGINYKSGWEADYRFMELLHKTTLGSIEIEVRRENSKQ